MITAKDVARYFLSMADGEEGSDISNLKLQKLLYYAQAFHLAIFEKPLFEEEMNAWAHGPVCPSVYHEYKRFGANPIPSESDWNPDLFSQEQLELLDEVNEVFGQFSAWKLRDMTHEDAPWREREASAGVIEKQRMMEFYKTRLK
uniref:Uncharacterized phage-associated protein n=1 Tax=Candidatus Kentrum sp. DK TaxID=2126562 RepID=A0A450TAZ4_9GAMM|nr:MAG: Uncharacterized phage-associated protein [Candidatus Kentron sp. DK]